MSELAPKKRKYKQKFYLQSSGRRHLECGQRGFLITHSYHEKYCLREAFNLLTQYANELYGIQSVDLQLPCGMSESTAFDIVDDLKNEITTGMKSDQKDRKKRFQEVHTGSPHILFIDTQLEKPTELVNYILKDILNNKKACSRYLLRLLPIETVCHANCSEIVETFRKLCDRHFPSDASTTFAIVFKKRYNSNSKIIEEKIVDKLAELVHSRNPANKVDLQNAAKTILVEIIRGLCCLSVLDDYIFYRKYNLLEMSKRYQNDLENANVAGANESK